MNSADYWTCVAGFIVNGLGTGLTLPAINLLVLEMTTGNTAAALSILNFCWGAGAIVSKPFVDYFGSPAASLSRPRYSPQPWRPAAWPPYWHTSVGPHKTAVDRGPEPDTHIWRTRVAWAVAL